MTSCTREEMLRSSAAASVESVSAVSKASSTADETPSKLSLVESSAVLMEAVAPSTAVSTWRTPVEALPSASEMDEAEPPVVESRLVELSTIEEAEESRSEYASMWEDAARRSCEPDLSEESSFCPMRTTLSSPR